MAKKVKSSIYETCEELREQIILHQITPGTRITEQSICDNHEVGRSTARNALQLLAQTGLVELIPNVGARVTVFSREQIKALCAIKNDLEIYSLNRTLDYYHEQDFNAMYEIVERERKGKKDRDILSYLKAVEDFHNYIVDKVGNEYLSSIFHTLSNKYTVYQILYDAFYELKEEELYSVECHPRIIEAIRDRRPGSVHDVLDELSAAILSYYDYSNRTSADTRDYPSVFF